MSPLQAFDSECGAVEEKVQASDKQIAFSLMPVGTAATGCLMDLIKKVRDELARCICRGLTTAMMLP